MLQFWHAITANIDASDCVFIKTNLPESSAQALFFAMHKIDQAHALRVAYTAIQLAKGIDNINTRLLLRAALLHDIGKRKGDMNLWGKVFAVLAIRIAPSLAMRMMCKEKRGRFGFWRHVIYIYKYHPKIGANLARMAGLFDEARLIEQHHTAYTKSDAIELILLRRADEMN